MKERIAAIDLGSNSFHLIVVEINPVTQSFKILDKLRETVRFNTFERPNKDLSKTEMKKAFETLTRFKKIAEGHNVSEIFASATSAVREASNGKEWLVSVREKLGIDAHPISGVEEARLIYLGVLSSLELKGRRVAIVDIGGGSTELITGDEQSIYHLSSSKVGAVRLTEQDLKTEINIAEKINHTEKHIEGLLATKIQDLKNSGGFDVFVGTSGTIRTLVKIDYKMHNFADADSEINLNGHKMTLAFLKNIIDKMINTPKSKRHEVLGISENRAQIILAGSIILKVIMEQLGVSEITYCDKALREGLIVDRLLQKGIIKNRLQYQQTIRERSVMDLAHKYNFHETHSLHVKNLALSIFEQTKGILHHYSDREKSLLEAASILHDIGAWINHNDHHKHTYYLIKHSGLLGFNVEDVAIIANIARYHRQNSPKDSHTNFQKLPRDHKKMVKDLSAMLRIAEGLDKGHKSSIKDVEISTQEDKNTVKFKLICSIKGYDCSLEIWSAMGKSKEFEKEFNVKVEFISEKSGKNKKVMSSTVVHE